MVKRAATTMKKPALKRQKTAIQSKALVAAMKPEKKNFDTIFSTTDPLSPMTNINFVQLGGANNERIGNQIRISNINVRFNLTYRPTVGGTTTTSSCRMLVVHDKAVNGALPVITDVLTANSTTQFRNPQQLPRFQVLYDEVHVMTPPGNGQNGTEGSDSLKFVTFSKSNLNIPILFNDTVIGVPPDITNLKTSGIFLVFIGLSTTTLSAGGTCRIKYFD